jgi:Outer membrane protein beta-barrel domain
MTSSAIRLVLLAALLTAVPTLASAQPLPGQVAAGGDIGLFVPSDEQLDAGWMADGFVEFYATRRVGFRPIVTAIRNGYELADDTDERQLRLGLDVIYNWEGGNIHPFLGAGIGIHFLRLYSNGDHVEPDDNNFGANVLGGLEVFLNRAWTVKFEGRYQWVEDRPHVDPDGFGLLVGLKRYF